MPKHDFQKEKAEREAKEKAAADLANGKVAAHLGQGAAPSISPEELDEMRKNQVAGIVKQVEDIMGLLEPILEPYTDMIERQIAAQEELAAAVHRIADQMEKNGTKIIG